MWEELHTFQFGKKLRPVIQQYFKVLFPPNAPSAPTLRPQKRRLEELTTFTWEVDSSAQLVDYPPPQEAHAPAPPTNEEEERSASSPQPKRRRLDRKNDKGLIKDTDRSVEVMAQMVEELWLSQKIPYEVMAPSPRYREDFQPHGEM